MNPLLLVGGAIALYALLRPADESAPIDTANPTGPRGFASSPSRVPAVIERRGPDDVNLGLRAGGTIAGTIGQLVGGAVQAVTGVVTGVAGLVASIRAGSPEGVTQSSLTVTSSATSAVATFAEEGSVLAETAVTAVPIVGGVAGLTGLAFSAEHDNIAGEAQSGLTLVSAGATAVETFAPTSTLAAGGTFGASLTAGGAATAAEAGTSAAGIVGGSASVVGLVLALGLITNMVLQIVFKRPNLIHPLGYSSANNRASQLSLDIAHSLSKNTIAWIQNHQRFDDLVNLAATGAALAPHGELYFLHDRAGHGGSVYDPMTPEYRQLIDAVWQGKVDALDEFLSGIWIVTGETGVGARDWAVTDWYRRTLVHTVDPNPQDWGIALTRYFPPSPGPYFTAYDSLVAYLFPGGTLNLSAYDEVNRAGGIAPYLDAYRKIGPSGSICPFFRDFSTREFTLTDDDLAAIAAQFRSQEYVAAADNDQRWLAYSQSGGE